ncbi:MAG: hypothetical protein HZA78_10190 [Candidatus Schekmanbacteria bacterium]|nr:hypothetical protein [Candidatus Schekmanbacteria bacterium]
MIPEEEKEQLKKMVTHLAKVINKTLNNSNVVREAMEMIRHNGYGVDLSLAACIGLYKEETPLVPSPAQTSPKCAGCNSCNQELKFEFGDADMDFLKAINLRISEE